MSRRVLHGIELDATPEAAWDAFARVEAWPRWFPSLTAVERPTTGAFTVGERLRLRLAFRGRGANVDVRVTHATLGREVRWLGRSYGVTGDHAFRVEVVTRPDGVRRARFVSEEIFSGLPVRLLPRSIFDEVERETVAGLARFKALVEG
jgi:hypothetical protein